MATQLSSGIIKILCEDIKPIVQIIQLEKSEEGLIKIKISDGINTMPALLAKSYRYLVEDDGLQINTIIRIQEYSRTLLCPRLLVINELDIVVFNAKLIGNPVNLCGIRHTERIESFEEDAQNSQVVTSVEPIKAEKIDQKVTPVENPESQSTQAVTPAISPQTDKSTQNIQIVKPAAEKNIQPIKTEYRSFEDALKLLKISNKKVRRVDLFNSIGINQADWTIKAKFVQKGKGYAYNPGEGVIFSLILEHNSGQIKAKAFRTQANIEYSKVELGKTYMVSGAYVKSSYDYSPDRPVELILECGTEVKQCKNK
ncbi:uncharacterized protein EV154DRAFT_476027 [Mucor mucedo]|uniref:uncharacterized protein n=1 Tax=Mucor mucedo TaxID=29922 RepID=UPI00221F15F6|nr:uncharacterized protein EV154DRAFT_476027 [Mucor mucedo]KAI7896805.1 hypothetical protein EV154DRAFT_476027 [Mucor mucedo]